MKKLFLLAAIALLSAAAALADDNEKVTDIDPGKLPPITQNFIRAYFPETRIVLCQKKKSKVKNDFEVKLDSGAEIYFDKEGQWQMVDCGDLPVPFRMIPGKIQMILSDQFSREEVRKILKDKKGNYQVFCGSGNVLQFDNQFRLIKDK